MIELELEHVPETPKKQTFRARFKPNTPIYALIGLVVLSAITGTILSPEWTVNILGFCLFIATSLFGIAKNNDAADRVAEQTAQVAVNLKERGESTEKHLKVIEDTAEKTHILVNSQMGEQLRIGMELSEFKAMTTKKPEDVKAAEMAKHKYLEHMKQQAVVDKKEDKPTTEATVFPETKPTP